MIRLENLSKAYRGRHGEVRALDGVDLAIQKGEFVAIRGPSGSGKSTALLTIAGMIRPTAGRALVDETDLYALSSQQRAQFRAQNIGFVFQMFHLVPYLSAFENVVLPTGLADGGSGPEAARELLSRFGMGQRTDHKPGELSTGERQRTAVARALVNDPWLILADEPTGNLDPENAAEILRYLCEFHEAGGTVVVVTHEELAAQHAQRTVLVREGRVEG